MSPYRQEYRRREVRMFTTQASGLRAAAWMRAAKGVRILWEDRS